MYARRNTIVDKDEEDPLELQELPHGGLRPLVRVKKTSGPRQQLELSLSEEVEKENETHIAQPPVGQKRPRPTPETVAAPASKKPRTPPKHDTKEKLEVDVDEKVWGADLVIEEVVEKVSAKGKAKSKAKEESAPPPTRVPEKMEGVDQVVAELVKQSTKALAKTSKPPKGATSKKGGGMKKKVEVVMGEEEEEDEMDVEVEVPRPPKTKSAPKSSRAKEVPAEPLVPKSAYDELKARFKELKLYYETAREEVTSLRTELDASSAKVRDLSKGKTRLAKLEADIVELKDENERLQHALNTANEDRDEIEVELEELKQRTPQKLVETVSVPVAVADPAMEKKLKSMRKKRDRLKIEKDRLEKTNLALIRSNEQLAKTAEDLEKNVATQSEDRRKAIAEVTQQVAMLEKELRDAREKAENTPESPLHLAYAKCFNHVLTLSKISEDVDLIYLTATSVHDETRQLQFELTFLGDGMVQYSPIFIGFEEGETAPDFILNDIFFKESSTPIFLSKVVQEVCKR